MNITANNIVEEKAAPQKNNSYQQLDLFTDYAAEEEQEKQEALRLDRERKLQETTITIKKKFGKNAILKGMSLQEGATAKNRNEQIGGHKA